MPGFTPNEGRVVIAELIYPQSNADRGSSLNMGLFKNTGGLDTGSVLADIIPITGGGYAPVSLADANWSVDAQGNVTFSSNPTWTAAGTQFDPIYGYYVFTTGATPRLMHVEVDPNAPVTKAIGVSYIVSLLTGVV